MNTPQSATIIAQKYIMMKKNEFKMQVEPIIRQLEDKAAKYNAFINQLISLSFIVMYVYFLVYRVLHLKKKLPVYLSFLLKKNDIRKNCANKQVIFFLFHQ
jgi:large-conductance mechanosensitive channel